MKDDFSLFPSNSCHCLCPFTCITEQFFANGTVKITDIKLYKGVVLFVLNLLEPLYNTDVVFELQVILISIMILLQTTDDYFIYIEEFAFPKRGAHEHII